MRNCIECGRDFKPSSRHKKCSACRSKARNKACQCGKVISKDATRCVSCNNKSGPTHRAWRGGKTKTAAGYVMVRSEGHPRANVKRPYVFEHILVMENFLGRYLFEGETVHHINGIKDDNRPENLELWCKPQPTGVRVEDAYKHALEIVERYKDLYE